METKQDPAPLHAECNHGQARRPPKIDLALLLVEMGRAQWTSNAIEYVKRAVNAHEELLAAAKEVYALPIGPLNNRARAPFDRLYKAIAKAEGK